MPGKFRFFPVLFLLFTITGPARAAYKWVDEEGNVHYTQTRPEGVVEAETIKPPPAPESVNSPVKPENDQQPVAEEGEGEETEKVVDEEEKKRIDEINKQKLAENRKGNCERTSKILNELQTYERVKTVGDDGVVRWASEDEMQAKLDEARKNVKKWCD